MFMERLARRDRQIHFGLQMWHAVSKRFAITGLEFCLPSTDIKREKVFAEFEILFAQLLHHKPKSIDELIFLKLNLMN